MSNPMLWGSNLWRYMHYAAINYPKNPTNDQIQEMENWLCSLAGTIPCKNCSKHYRGYIEKSKPRLHDICSNKDSLFNFLVDLHNKVNVRTGKPEISYEEARNLYDSEGCTSCGTN